jgi:hypothetical protein
MMGRHADCGKTYEEAKAAGHSLVQETECNGLGCSYGVWRCTECSQDEELKAKRKAARNSGIAAHLAKEYAKQFVKVDKFVKEAVTDAATLTGLWPQIIEQMGEDRFRALVTTLQAALDESCPSDPVKAAADRAESKTRH